MVGAGPTGLTLAVQLARYGVPVRIIDAQPAPSTFSKALGVQARTLELFERIGIAEQVIASGIQYREVFVHSSRKLIVHESLVGIRSKYNYVLAIPQWQTEAILTERLRALGVEVERGTQLVHLEHDAASVRVHLRGREGETDREYPYVVGCDGAHSAVRHFAELKFTGETLTEQWALADVRLDADFPRDAVSVFLSPGNMAGVFPLPQEITRIIIGRPSGGYGESPPIDDFRSSLYLAGAEIRSISEVLWTAQFTVNQRRVQHMQKGRLFLAGDASHIHSPVGAQGMNTGIQDVENLAWKLALALHHPEPKALLDSYGIEREQVAAALVRATGAFTKLVANPNPAVRAVRDRVAAIASAIPMAQDRFRDAVSELGIIYARSPIVAYGSRTPDPKPGAHAPDGSFARAGDGTRTSVYELIAGLHFVLLVFTYRRDQFEHELLVAMGKYNEIVDTYVVARDASIAGAHLLDPPGAVFKAYGADGEPQYVLIRPDGYVAARGAVRDYGSIVTLLKKISAVVV